MRIQFSGKPEDLDPIKVYSADGSRTQRIGPLMRHRSYPNGRFLLAHSFALGIRHLCHAREFSPPPSVARTEVLHPRVILFQIHSFSPGISKELCTL
jgi:hypothetical protein